MSVSAGIFRLVKGFGCFQRLVPASWIGNMPTRTSAGLWNLTPFSCCRFHQRTNYGVHTSSRRLPEIMAAHRHFMLIRQSLITISPRRFQSNHGPKRHAESLSHKNKTVLIYLISMVVFVVGMSFASVPLYRLYCQATGKGGIAIAEDTVEKVKKMKRVPDRVITIYFNADTASSLQWNFKPQQTSIKLVPGETALAFYTARNPTNRPIDGVATYNVIPYEAAQYFNKIQCFCFEEQRLNPHEEVDMPVFFYIDPEFMEDPRMETVDDITLSYTFFEAKEGMTLPFPIPKK